MEIIMEEDLKASLEWLKDCAENEYIFETGDSKLLLDYITNLQQELERYKHYSKTTGIEELMQENERLKDIVVEKDSQIKEMILQKTDYTAVNILEMKLEDYKSRVEKTNEYVEEHITADSNVDGDMWYTLCNNTSLDDFIINIRNFLQGGKDE